MTTMTMVRPRIEVIPEGASSAGDEAVELAALAGLHLDPWQAHVLRHSLAEKDDGRWAAFEVGLVMPRQNGKGGVLEARELAGLFLLGERLMIHSAHEFATSRQHQARIETLIRNTPELHARVKAYKHAHGEEGIYLKDGRSLLFRTRTKGGGRGFSADLVVFDEAMILPESTIGALLPTLSARPNPQVWFTGSAVDQAVHLDGLVLARLRERAADGSDRSMAFFEWSAAGDGPETVPPAVSADPGVWQEANPAMGIRISAEHIAAERRSMDPRTFAVERLGIGDWPDTDPAARALIEWGLWTSLGDPESHAAGAVALAFDIAPDRGSAAICAAGLRPDGLTHVQVVEHRPGVAWLADAIRQMQAGYETLGVWCDANSQAASLAEDVGATTTNTAEFTRACALMFDAAVERDLRHLAQPSLDNALRGAARRNVGEAWAWGRRQSGVDITPLVAASLAVWAVHHASGPVGVGWDVADLEAVMA